MLLLGVVQAQAEAVSAGAYDLLATEILTGSQASVTFSSLDTLAAGYQHLQIRAVARSTRSDTDSYYYVQLNGDSAANYSGHGLVGTGSLVSSSNTSTSYPNGLLIRGGVTGDSNTSNNFGAAVIDILDPFETTKYKTMRTLDGQAWSSYSRIYLGSGNWRSTSAVTSITIDDIFGSFVQYSRFSLYGLKAGA